jgi:hypothetical protein
MGLWKEYFHWSVLLRWDVLSWIIGAFLAVGGIVLFFDQYVAAIICFMLTTIFIFAKITQLVVESHSSTMDRLLFTFVLFGVFGIGIVETIRGINHWAQSKLETKSDSSIESAKLPPTPPVSSPAPQTAVSKPPAKPQAPENKEASKSASRERALTDLGVHNPNETVTVPPNSFAIFKYGNPSPKDMAEVIRMQKEQAEAVEHLTKESDKLVLRDLFLTDFSVGDTDTTSTNRGGFTIQNNETKALTHVEYVVVRQVETGTKFLKFYILYTSETERICKDLADKYEFALNSFLEGRVDTQKTPGDAEAISSNNLTFSKRIFIYHETYLSPEQVIAVRTTYEGRGLTVVLRSTDYLDNQRLKAKVKQLENKR